MRPLNALTLLAALALGNPGCDPPKQGANAASPPAANASPANANGAASANPSPVARGSAQESPPVYTYEVVHAWPHDPSAFTQGLAFHAGVLFESTGEVGRSSLRRVEPATGRVLKKVDVPPPYFAEGLTLLGGKIYQLTWLHRRGFVYDLATLKKTGEFAYNSQGWGLTHDGESLIMSDGSHQLRFLDPNTFSVRRTVSVFEDGRPLEELNELEYVRGEIFANVWHQNRIARIDPQTGRIVGWVDLTGLIAPSEVRNDPEAVPNGIAYDADADRLFVTGKLWPKLFEIKLKQK